MNRRLNTLVDSTVPSFGHSAERTKASPATGRSKLAKNSRSEHKPTRTKPTVAKPHANAPRGVSMDYQMGFTSGFSV